MRCAILLFVVALQLACGTSAGLLPATDSTLDTTPTDVLPDEVVPDLPKSEIEADALETVDGIAIDSDVINPPPDYHPLFDYAGTIELRENTLEDGTFTHSQPAVYLNDDKAAFIYVLVEEAGDCQYFQAIEECDPACTGEHICQSDGSCHPFPAPVSAGAIQFGGLLVDLIATPLPSNSYTTAPLGYVGDLFDPGANVSVSASGSDIAKFEAGVSGVANLAVPWEGPYSLTDLADNVIMWTPAGSGTVEVAFNAGWHATQPAHVIWCTAPDDQGQIVIPQSMAKAYVVVPTISDQDPPSFIRRVSRVVHETQYGPVAISASSRVEFFLLHF